MKISNNNTGTHSGHITKLASVNIGQKHLLGVFGKYYTQVEVCKADQAPFGVMTDIASINEPINVAILGNTGTSLKMVAAVAIKAGSMVFTADNGRIQALPTVKGNYYEIGMALTDAEKDDDVEVASCVARKVTI
ncbi:MAG: hypothetical protein A2Y14_01820 [Verrucomicrobia bacterium GWF2_51_19]|nr:MAG: hypothetical protein A2Y14_01820 [Verrucomicrobia bacterium GWF2_51_19]HCJ11602.1 hypothetical protein [Opitutae bacterium]